MWGVGVIAYLLLSGGVSPFWAGNRYRTMAKVLSCDYDYDKPNFSHVGDTARDFISRLLLLDPKVCRIFLKDENELKSSTTDYVFQERMSATDCLSHDWLTDTRVGCCYYSFAVTVVLWNRCRSNCSTP